MKIILIIFLSIFSLNVLAYDHSYSVSGTDENGESVDGTVYSNNGDQNVSGEVTDENGDTHSFQGQWDGNGQISGETDDENFVELNTNY